MILSFSASYCLLHSFVSNNCHLSHYTNLFLCRWLCLSTSLFRATYSKWLDILYIQYLLVGFLLQADSFGFRMQVLHFRAFVVNETETGFVTPCFGGFIGLGVGLGVGLVVVVVTVVVFFVVFKILMTFLSPFGPWNKVNVDQTMTR